MDFKDFNDFIKATNPPQSVMSRLEALKGLRERPDFHPEESAFEHIRIVTERLIPSGDMDLILGGCLHDLFKHDTARLNPKTGYMSCYGHDNEVAKFIQGDTEIQEWIKSCGADPIIVMGLCKDHMRFHQFDVMKKSKQNELMETEYWDKLNILGAADDMLKDFKLYGEDGKR